jgi:threonine-phosphate decarboxylase
MNLTHGGNIFAAARAHGWDWRDIADFSASINPLGPAPGVLDAIRGAIGRIVHYPEREPVELAAALAAKWNVAPEQLLLGNGATELIHFLARSSQFENVTLAVPVFTEFHRAFPGARMTPAGNLAGWPREGALVVTQPLNPTGALLDLGSWLQETSNPVLVDESFIEFTGRPSALRFLATRSNLFILRSLTKYYALPGLRVGAIVASAASIAVLRARREPWQVNALAERAALAALADEEHAARTLAFVEAERAWLYRKIAALPGAHPQPSHANYLLVALDYAAPPLIQHLLERKILARDCSGWPGVEYPHAVRVAVRARPENERLLNAWGDFPCG